MTNSWPGPILTDDPEFNREALPWERAICCAFLLMPDDSIREWKCRVSGIENPGSMFRDERHKLLVQKLIKLHTAGVKCFDYTTLHSRCDASEIESFGGWKYIVSHQEYLLMGASFHVQMDHLISRHRVIEFGKLAAYATESAIDQHSLNEAIAMFNAKATSLIQSEAEMITPTVEAVLDAFDVLTTESEAGNRIPTSFRTLASYAGDYPRREIRLVGAPMGNGKTAFAMQEIECALLHGFTVDAFLMESSFEQFLQRYLMRNAVVPGGRFNRKFYTREESRRLMDCRDQFQKFENHLHVSKPGYYSVDDMDRIIQNRKAATGLPCDFIVVDYFDKMKHPKTDKGMGDYEAQKVSVYRLHELAARENAALLLLDQLTVDAVRNSFKGGSKMPTMGAFRGGTTAQVAKVVIVLHKDEQDMLNADTPVVEQHIVVCKANDGSTGAIPSLFLKPFAMHVEDADFPQGRIQSAKWLEVLKYDPRTPRKAVK